jgi:hypothetical protein
MSEDIALCYSKSNVYPVDRNDTQALANFQRDNSHIKGTFISAGTPFIMRTHSNNSSNDNSIDWKQARPDLVCSFKKIQSLSQKSKRKIALMDDMLGSDQLQAIADFYQAKLAPMAHKESIGAIGAASTALDTRLSNFAKAANKVREVLEKVREGAQAKLPKHKMMVLEDNARRLSKDFNSKFQAEINKYVNRVKNKKGTVYTNAQRGINKAKSSRTIMPIQFTTASAFQNLRAFETGANILGKSLIVLDAGIRAGNVHVDYLSGKNWEKRATVEMAGFGFGTAAGIFAGQTVVSSAAGLGIALLATPVGWVIIIGAAITVGIVAAKGGDWFGQLVANKSYDFGTWLNGL